MEVDNRMGTIRFIGSGRAQVDFNHRLAGKSIVYDFEVIKQVDTDEDKVRALIDRRLAGEGSKATFEMSGGALTVSIPEDLFLVEGLQIIKRGIANDVFKFVPSAGELTFTEKFTNEKAKPKEETKEEKPASEAVAPKTRKTRAGTRPKTG